MGGKLVQVREHRIRENYDGKFNFNGRFYEARNIELRDEVSQTGTSLIDVFIAEERRANTFPTTKFPFFISLSLSLSLSSYYLHQNALVFPNERIVSTYSEIPDQRATSLQEVNSVQTLSFEPKSYYLFTTNTINRKFQIEETTNESMNYCMFPHSPFARANQTRIAESETLYFRIVI